MTYELFIGDRAFSSWSLRGWLMFEKFNIPYKTRLVGLYGGTLKQDLAALAPARYVPVMRTSSGVVIGDTLAMAETLAEAFPDRAMWPENPKARGLARWMVAEMHAGFHALRGDCPMQILHQWIGFAPSQAVRDDLARIQELWACARAEFGAEFGAELGTGGPWLFGAYSLADAFFAPVAMRIAGYDLPVSAQARAYVSAHLADPAFHEWRRDALAVSYDPMPYQLKLKQRAWPQTG